MQIDTIFGGNDGFSEKLGKSERAGLLYTADMFKKCTEEKPNESDAILRNNRWKDETSTFNSNSFGRTEDGRLNNSHYRTKMRYDVVVPYNVYREVMEWYFYCIESNVEEDVEYISRNLDNIMVFCHLVRNYNKRYLSWHHCRKDLTPLAVKLIHRFIGREYRKVVSLLEKIGVLNFDRMYIPGIWDNNSKTGKRGICRHFGFETPCDDRYVVYQVTKRTIISKVYSQEPIDELEYVSEGERPNSNTIKDKALNKWFSVNFDLSGTVMDDRAADYDGFNYYFSKISSGDEKYKNFTVGRDKFGHRLYHPFLNINSVLRKHVEINGSKDTSTIDINNSHPYFFSLLFDGEFLEQVSHLLTEEEAELFRSVSANPANAEKIDVFKRITASGGYYNFLRENVKSSVDIKRLNMYYFYAKLNRRNGIYKYFSENFDFINYVKIKLIKLGGYKRLCQILQRIEAFVMIDRVFTPLRQEGVKLIPLHDAMMCRKEDANQVRKTMLDAFRGLSVTYMPTFDKAKSTVDLNLILDEIKRKNFNMFINKTLVYEGLNNIIKSVGICNRVFKEEMKEGAIQYIDQRFESLRHLLEESVVEKYYEFRMAVDAQDFVKFDFDGMYSSYKDTILTKKKFFAREVVDNVKVNPIEFFNHQNNTAFKARVRENKYIY